MSIRVQARKTRVAFIGVNHWHTRLYLEPALARDDIEIVGVSDPDLEVARARGEQIGCVHSADFRELLASTQPDFVFAFGRHIDMYETARFLIEGGYPAAMEKPCGINAREVSQLRDLAASTNAFFAVPLVYRQSAVWSILQERQGGAPFDYMNMRYISGPATRYGALGNAWVTDRALSGGGSTINLGPHFFDLAAQLLGPDVEVESATMSNAAHGFDVEDYSLVVLRSGDRRATVETGYLLPFPKPDDPLRRLDLRLSFVAGGEYFLASDPATFEVVHADGARDVHAVSTVNTGYYALFVEDVLARLRDGRTPVAGLDDMVRIMELVDRAYELAR